jgi:hypothetical protein
MDSLPLTHAFGPFGENQQRATLNAFCRTSKRCGYCHDDLSFLFLAMGMSNAAAYPNTMLSAA